MIYTISFIGSYCDYEEVLDFLHNRGLDCPDLEYFIKKGSDNMTVSMIAEALEGKFSTALIGAYLSSHGFDKKSIRVAGKKNPVKGYGVKLVGVEVDERILRFKKAQEKGLCVEGLYALDFDNPEEFNQAVEIEKEKLKLKYENLFIK